MKFWVKIPSPECQNIHVCIKTTGPVKLLVLVQTNKLVSLVLLVTQYKECDVFCWMKTLWIDSRVREVTVDVYASLKQTAALLLRLQMDWSRAAEAQLIISLLLFWKGQEIMLWVSSRWQLSLTNRDQTLTSSHKFQTSIKNKNIVHMWIPSVCPPVLHNTVLVPGLWQWSDCLLAMGWCFSAMSVDVRNSLSY